MFDRYFSGFAAAVAFSCSAFAAGCSYVDGGDEEGILRMTFLDVGQGLAVLLDADGRYALYDTGPDSVGVIDSLVVRGVDTLEWVVVSHSHRDHAGGFMEIGGAGKLRNGNTPRVHVRRLYVGPDTSRGFIRDTVLRVARRFGIPVDTLVRGATLGQGGSSAISPRVEVLWPPERLQVGENAASVVLQVDYGAATALLLGDLDSAGERRLLELSPSLGADLMQVGHHGSAGSSTLEFLSKVAPEYAVVSVGAGNPYGHPANSVVRKFEFVLGDTARLYRTDRDGSVSFEFLDGIGVISSVP